MARAAKKWTDEEIEIAEKLYDDYEFYAENALKIKPKDKNAPGVVNGLIPFKFNTAQRYINWRLNKQLAEIGRVRAFIVKGRQQGISTWIIGKYFHKTSMNYGRKTTIQAHNDEATTNLYRMAQRNLNNLPLDIRPVVGVSNRKELIFSELDSGYRVNTAGAKETGRSDNPDYLHCSEVAFWKNAEGHAAGLLQGIADINDTWVTWESTANGTGNYFHRCYKAAEAGTHGDYIAIFIPWYWQEEYRKKAPDDFVLTDKESELVELHNKFPEFDADGNVTIVNGRIDNDQMYWWRCKAAELGGEALAKQEYPFNAEMAFQFSAVDSHIKPESVLKALNRPQYRSYGAITAGFDPSFTEDGDRKAFIYKQGGNAWGLEYPVLKDHDAQVAYCKRKLDDKSVILDKLFIDAGGGGYAIVQCLIADGYGNRVELVNSARSAEEDYKYANCRAEMTDRIKLHLEDNDMPLSISIDDELKDAFITDMTAEGSFEDRNNRLIIEKKEDVKTRLGISPEAKDALGLNYSRKIIRNHVMSGRRQQTGNSRKTPVFRV